MEANRKTQVIIIGAGPTGLALAVQLLRYNIDFIILEKNPETTHLSKAVIVQARTLEIFREISLSGEAISVGRITTAMNIFHNGKRRVHLNLAGLGEGISPFPFALSLEQSKTEKLLVDYLTKKGETVNWNSDLLGFTQDQQSVTANFKDSEGQEKKIEANYIVGCDGARSLVRQQSGISFEGDTIAKIFYVADVTLQSPIINKSELFIFLIKKGFILFFPMEGSKHYRVIGILPEMTETESADLTFQDIRESIKEQVSIPLEFEEINWFSHYKVHSRKAESFRNQRCFIAGDAAHIHTPAGGQGMNTGIQDAYNLAWKLAFTLKGITNDSVLESYNTERMKNATHLLHTTDRMFDIIAGTNRIFDFIRLNIFPVFAAFISRSPMLNKFIFPLISQTAISYPDSDLTISSKIGKVKAGDRMHYFEFKGGTNIFDYLNDPVFKLLYFGKAVADLNRLADYGIEVVQHSFTEIPKKLFGNTKDFYILLRPDNHICYLGKELEACKKLLSKITSTTA